MSDFEEKKCHSIFKNLVKCQARNDIPASAFIREFFQTKRCDRFTDFSTFRKDIEMKLSEDEDQQRLVRILRYKERDEDEKVAAQTCIHYGECHNKLLVQALSWPDWFQYQTLDRSERTLATLGIIGLHMEG